MSPIATASLHEDVAHVVSKIGKLSTRSIVDQLTLEEKVSLVSGRSFHDTPAVDRLNIPSIKVSDGPSGCRGEQSADGPASAMFPNAACIASTFDSELVERVGREIGKDSHSKSVNVLIAPTINLHRDPRGGRNFECFSEDPVLTGAVGSAFVKGLQSEGVGACLKHLICNERETNRKSYNVKISSAALREVYLKPFEDIINNADPYSIMAAYNDINDVPCSHATEVLDIVRNEFKYDGLIMSDWFGTKDGMASLQAGVDLEMPFPVTRGGRLAEAVRSGRIPSTTLDKAAARVADLASKTAAKHTRKPERPFNGDSETIAVARQVAADGMVLLRNEKETLPLKTDASILVVGELAVRPSVSGGGSAMLNPPHISRPLDAIRQATSGSVAYHPGVPAWRLVPELDSDLCDKVNIELRNAGSDNIAWSTTHEKASISLLDQRIESLGPDFTITLQTTIHPTQTGRHLLSIFCVAETKIFLNDQLLETITPPHISVEQFLFRKFDFENVIDVDLTAGKPVSLRVVSKSKPKTGFEPPPQGLRIGLVQAVDEQKSIEQAVEMAQNAEQVVVFTGLNFDWEGEGADKVDIHLPRKQAELVSRLSETNAKIILVNQSGSPIDLRFADKVESIVQEFYGGMECGNALADVLFGKINPSGRLAMTFPRTIEECPTYESFMDDSQGLIYEEESLFGYRSYQKLGLKPAYPFGYGLTYTTFKWDNATVSHDFGKVTVEATISNTGSVSGRDVVQVYVSSEVEPYKLEGFAKTKELKAGESERITVRLDERAFARWTNEAWTVKKGKWRVSLSKDAASEVVGFDVIL